jgi:hypothetical protein
MTQCYREDFGHLKKFTFYLLRYCQNSGVRRPAHIHQPALEHLTPTTTGCSEYLNVTVMLMRKMNSKMN